MNSRIKKVFATALLPVVLALSGCLISGTFVLIDKFTFTPMTGFYFYAVDVTDESDWADNKDKIDFIDEVGAEFYLRNTGSSDATFSAWVDDFGSNHAAAGAVEASATLVIDSIMVPAGGSLNVTYAQSFQYISGIAILKALAKTGKFDFYGTSTGAVGSTFFVDSAKVIITVSGG